MKQTPCEKLGYKVGDRFEVLKHCYFPTGEYLTLCYDDNTTDPEFRNKENKRGYVPLGSIKKIEPQESSSTKRRYPSGYHHGTLTITKRFPKKRYSSSFDHGTWVITKDGKNCPMDEIINTLNEI